MARNTVERIEVVENLCRQNLDAAVERSYASRLLELNNAKREIADREARELAKAEADRELQAARYALTVATEDAEKKAALANIAKIKNKVDNEREALKRTAGSSATVVSNVPALDPYLMPNGTRRIKPLHNEDDYDEHGELRPVEKESDEMRLRRGVLATTAKEISRTEAYLRKSNDDAKIFGGAKTYGVIVAAWSNTLSADNKRVNALNEVQAIKTLIKNYPDKGKQLRDQWIEWAQTGQKPYGGFLPRPSQLLGEIGFNVKGERSIV